MTGCFEVERKKGGDHNDANNYRYSLMMLQKQFIPDTHSLFRLVQSQVHNFISVLKIALK